ncbi:MAG: TetR/AcrR family transcriptional regulator, partial [Pseudomonadota bacterium]
MKVFWAKGYAATGITELQSAMGIGRKSLYDTFGNKRDVYLRALSQYTGAVIERIRHGLRDDRNTPLENLERVLTKLGKHHGTEQGVG